MDSSNIKNNIKFTEYIIQNNGLRVILHKDITYPIIAVTVLYHVGSKNEKKGNSGFAHFFEHLMFEGSKNIGRGEFFKYVSMNGGISNAYTNQDETCYYEVFPSNQLKLALWLESERMLHAIVDHQGIITQKKVVKEEKKMYIDNSPYKTAINIKIPFLIFKNHKYKNPIIGSIKDINSATYIDFKNFYKNFYNPNNAILSIAGDININNTKQLIKDYFENIPNKNSYIHNNNIKEEIINNKEIKSIYKDKNIKVPAVILAYLSPKKNSYDSYIMSIIDNILSQGESSKIIKNIVNKYQLAAYAGSFLQDLEDYGLFTIYAIINNNIKLDILTEAIDNEIEQLKQNSITQIELDKQINILEKFFIENNSSMLGIASNLSHYSLYYNNTNLINEILNIYKNISINDIKRVANKYLNKNNRVRLYNIPY